VRKGILVSFIGVLGLFLVGAAVEEVTREEFDKLTARVTTLEERSSKLEQTVKHLKAELERYQKPSSDTVDKRVNRHTRTYSLKDLPPPNLAGMQQLVGNCIYGPARLLAVDPDGNEAGKYVASVVDTSKKGSPFVAHAGWCHGAWWQIRCYYQCEQAAAMRLDKGDEFNIHGRIERFRIQKPKPNDKWSCWVLHLYLSDAEIR